MVGLGYFVRCWVVTRIHWLDSCSWPISDCALRQTKCFQLINVLSSMNGMAAWLYPRGSHLLRAAILTVHIKICEILTWFQLVSQVSTENDNLDFIPFSAQFRFAHIYFCIIITNECAIFVNSIHFGPKIIYEMLSLQSSANECMAFSH